MSDLSKYPKFANNPDIQQLIKEGWEFYVEEWTHPHDGDEGTDLKYRKKSSSIWGNEWLTWGDREFTRREFENLQALRKGREIMGRIDVEAACIKSLIDNEFKAINITINDHEYTDREAQGD